MTGEGSGARKISLPAPGRFSHPAALRGMTKFNTQGRKRPVRSLKLRIPLAVIAALIAVAAFAGTASAGSYKVYTCQHPDGSPAPVDGWSMSSTAGAFWAGTNSCSSGGPLQARLGHEVNRTAGESVRWTFAPQRNILSFDVWRAGVANVSHPAFVNGIAQFLTTSPGGSTPNLGTVIDNGYVGATSPGVSDATKVSRTALEVPSGTTSFIADASCTGNAGLQCTPTANPPVATWVSRADFVLEDNDLPTATAPSGALVGTGTHSGTEAVQFTATDPNYSPSAGSGIYKATVEVDGQIVQSVVPNDNGGKCVTIGADSTYNDFDYIQPCPASTPISLEFNSKTIADGAHSLRIRVYDAAGNGNTVYGPATYTTKNAPEPNPGQNGSNGGNGGGGNLTTARFSSTSAKGNLIRTKYGVKKTLATRLTDAVGAPITGAQVDVFEFVNVAGATEHRTTTLQSDAQGWVTYTPRTTANKLITFKWERQIGSSSYQATDATTLIVNGALRMKAKHRKLRSRGKLQMTGKLYGEDMPKSVPIQIQVKKGKKWSVVSIVNTKKNGTFKWNYRFKYTARGKFTFRALVRKSSDLSVEASRSKAVKIKVR